VKSGILQNILAMSIKVSMELVTSFAMVVQSLNYVMTAPSLESWQTIVIGWVFAKRYTVTRMIVAAGATDEKHYSSFHRFFSQASWSRDELGLAIFDLLRRWPEVVVLGIDDTLARKRGLIMFGTGMHLDPLLSGRGYNVTTWAHCWVLGRRQRINDGKVIYRIIERGQEIRPPRWPISRPARCSEFPSFGLSFPQLLTDPLPSLARQSDNPTR
jgi:hypothetical protein